MEEIPVREQLATDQTDPWQVVPRQVFTPYSRLLISTEFVVVSRVGCLGLTGVGPLCWCYPVSWFLVNRITLWSPGKLSAGLLI